MREKVLSILVLSGCVFVSACSTSPTVPAMLYEGDVAPRLGEQYVGKPIEAAVRTAGMENMSRQSLRGGGEMLTWQRANVHRGFGTSISCREVVTARDGIIRSYDRSGDGCAS